MKSTLKIALINNMNGNFCGFARYLHDANIEFSIIQLDTLPDHFHPKADTDRVEILDRFHDFRGLFTIQKFWMFPWLLRFSRRVKEVKRLIKSHDLVIACGGLEYLELMKIRIDIFLPYGADLLHVMNRKFDYPSQNKLLNAVKDSIKRWLLSKRIAAIKQCRVVLFPTQTQSNLDDTLAHLNRKNLDFNLPYIYKELSQNTEEWAELKLYDFVAWSHLRHFCSDEDHEAYSGIDIAIKGFAQFLKQQSTYKNPVLVLFNYGQEDDLKHSRDVIENLGIQDKVIWKPLMYRKDILRGLSMVDVAFSSFFKLNGCGGSVNKEIFILQKVGIGNCYVKEDPRYNQPGVSPLPDRHNHARSPKEVCDILLDYEQDPKKYHQKAKENYDWLMRTYGPDSIPKYVKLFDILLTYPDKQYEDLKDLLDPIFQD